MTLKFSIDFVTNFLKENGDDTIQQKWSIEQVKFKKLFKKNESKSTFEKGPKKNKSAYNIYCSENMKHIKEELTGLDNKKIFSEMASRWKSIKDTEEYKKYKTLADEDKDRYIKEKNAISGENLDKFKVKKPKNSYMMFCEEERKIILDLKGKELLIQLGVRWQDLKKNNSKKLEHFINLANADKERYLNEVKNGPTLIESEEPELVVVDEEPAVEEPVVVDEVHVVDTKNKKQTKKKEDVTGNKQKKATAIKK